MSEAREHPAAAWRTGEAWPIVFCSPADLSCVEVDRDGLLSPQTAGAAVWHAAAAERHETGGHLLADISSAPPGTAPDFLRSTSYETWPRYLARFRDALVFPRLGVVMPEPGKILAESAAAARWGAPRMQGLPGVSERNGDLVIDPAIVTGARTFDRPAVLLCHNAHQIYGHWFMDVLPGALALRDELTGHRRALLAPPLAPWQRASLGILGIADAASEVTDEVVWARDLVFSSYLDTGDVLLPSSAARRTFAALTGPTKPRAEPGGGLLYVSRAGYAANRRMTNEPVLELALAALGYAIVRPEQLSLDRQIALFAAARVIIAPHGSGQANIGFTAPGCIVVDLLLSSVPDPWIYRLSALLGHRYAYLVTPAPPMTRVDAMGVTRHDPAAGYEIDIDAVIRLAAAAKRLAGSG
jgi:capsular polysaccharide biosynthesis protein